MKPLFLTAVELDAKVLGVELLKLGPNGAATPFRMARILAPTLETHGVWTVERAHEALRCLVEHKLAEPCGHAKRYRLTRLGEVQTASWSRADG